MPLIYLPLIIYAGWMECMFEPFVKTPVRAQPDSDKTE